MEDDDPAAYGPTRYAMGFTLEEWACVKRALMTWRSVETWISTTAVAATDQERREAEQELVTIDSVLTRINGSRG